MEPSAAMVTATELPLKLRFRVGRLADKVISWPVKRLLPAAMPNFRKTIRVLLVIVLMVPLRNCESSFTRISYLCRNWSSLLHHRVFVHRLDVRPHLFVLRFALRPDGAFVLRRSRSPRGIVRGKKHVQQFLYRHFSGIKSYFQRFRVPVPAADRLIRHRSVHVFGITFPFCACVPDGHGKNPRNGLKRFRGGPKSSQREP